MLADDVHERIARLSAVKRQLLEQRLRAILASRPRATLIEFDMDAIGPFAQPFSGPRI